ncbi:hypothetical protein GCM10010483_10880 [Actinokineospora diospyrosa]
MLSPSSVRRYALVEPEMGPVVTVGRTERSSRAVTKDPPYAGITRSGSSVGGTGSSDGTPAALSARHGASSRAVFTCAVFICGVFGVSGPTLASGTGAAK